MAITDTVRKYVEAGREALSPGKAEDMARTLARQGEIRRDQVSGLARDLVEWSRRNRERLLELIRREVKKQIARAGVATKDDVDSLKRRVRQLERGRRGAPKARGARTTSRAAGTKSTGGARGTAAKKTTRSARPRKKTTTARRTTT